jgi:4-amino-4-deoxy-L-arabinose transferase-like glycosyltransferase
VTLAARLAVGALVAVALGQDANWDLRNYHLYNVWAWLHGRLQTDLAAAGPQSYYNPLLDLPYYLMGVAGDWRWPRLVAAAQGLWYGALIFVVWRIVAALARMRSRPFDAGDAAAVAIGVTGSAAVAQAGTTFNEIPLAVLVLAGLLLVLDAVRTLDPPSRRQALQRTCAAGVLAGLAAGLKPTAIIYLPALGLALLLAAPKGRRMSLAAVFALAAALGFLAAYGWWGWWLYQSTGNPVFPYFNNIFHSDWAASVNGTDARFRPRDAWQWLFYPFYWAVHRVSLVTEPRMLDARFAFAYLAGALMLAQSAFRAWRRRPAGPACMAERAVLVFALAGYVCWLVLFSILRYAIPIEAVTGVVIVMAVRRLADGRATGATPAGLRLARNVALGIAVVLVLGTHRPEWRRVDYRTPVFEVRVPPVPDGSLVLFVGQPHAYLAPFFHARDLTFVGVSWLTGASRRHRLWSLTQQRLAAHRGPMYAVLGDESTSERKLLPGLGVKLTGQCTPVQSNLERNRRGDDLSFDLRVCRVVRTSGR